MHVPKDGTESGSHRQFQEVVRLDPENYVAWFNMGNALSDLQDIPQAIQCYRNSVRANPAYDRAWHNLGDALVYRFTKTYPL